MAIKEIALPLGLLALAFGYLAIIPHLGYLSSTSLFIGIGCLALGYRNLTTLLVVMGVWNLVVYLLFLKLLHLPLP